NHGYLVVRIDNRGTTGRGHVWERAVLARFAEVPLEDQVTALQALAKVEPALDLSRVGIFGHSYGGFMSALAVERRPDVFRAGKRFEFLPLAGITHLIVELTLQVRDWQRVFAFFEEHLKGPR